MKAITLKDDQKISEPGVYDIPIDLYHSQCTDGPSLSSTGIRRILRSPAHYWKYSELNPDHAEEEDKEAYVLGRAAHHLLLGEKEFGKHFVIRPDEAPDGRAWNGNNNSCKAWLAEQHEKGLTVLTPSQVEKIRGMAGLLPWQKGMTNCGLANTPLVASGGALSGEIERSLFFKLDGVWLKSRPDAIPNDSNDYADLKTTSSKSMAGVDDFTLTRAVRDHLYHVQGALVGMASSNVLGRQMEGFHLVFVDTGDVHAVSTKTLDETDIIDGERAIYVALGVFKKCLASGVWPGPTAAQTDAQRLSLYPDDRARFSAHLDRLEQEFKL